MKKHCTTLCHILVLLRKFVNDKNKLLEKLQDSNMEGFFFLVRRNLNMEVRNRLMIKIFKMLSYKSYKLTCQIIKKIIYRFIYYII